MRFVYFYCPVRKKKDFPPVESQCASGKISKLVWSRSNKSTPFIFCVIVQDLNVYWLFIMEPEVYCILPVVGCKNEFFE